MKLPAWSVLCLLPLLLSACTHKTPQVQNQTLAPAIAAPAPPNPTPVELPPSTTTIPTQPTENAQAPSQPVKPPPARRRPVTPPPATATQQAATDAPGVSAIGQLSSGDPADIRQQTEDTIIVTERNLNSINHPLSDSEQATADHIREFLKQARTALGSGDIDGAHTLAAKAKVLLGELTNP